MPEFVRERTAHTVVRRRRSGRLPTCRRRRCRRRLLVPKQVLPMAAAMQPAPGTVVRLLRLAGFPILRQLQLEEALLRCARRSGGAASRCGKLRQAAAPTLLLQLPLAL